MTPSNYDEAQERLELLKDVLDSAKFVTVSRAIDLDVAKSALEDAERKEKKAMREYMAHLESMVEAAAAEKAVRG